ncbi:MAG: 50S ribosomal protein L19 [candidate division TM6 bacterium GW2011_GWF2_43_17]|nr:MAG: 50S ribosomal protein L19 [candidate division TM6 bacterium GW2011_GWF2_43_17]HAU30161.1 50S ribosomal protein L19 [Candidatus Dependentiae bacterium]
MKAKGITKETILDRGVANRNFPSFSAGDAVRVAYRIKEGNKERTQYFEGDVIAIHNNGISSTFIVRRIGANGIAVERIFPYHSPRLEGVEFLRHGDVRRAKLYYMRSRIGKKARVQELVLSHEAQERRARAQEAHNARNNNAASSVEEDSAE